MLFEAAANVIKKLYINMPLTLLFQIGKKSLQQPVFLIVREKKFGESWSRKCGSNRQPARMNRSDGLANPWPAIENINDTARKGLVSFEL